MKRNDRLVALLTGAMTITVLGVASYLEWPNLCFWYRFEPLGLNAKGFAEYRHRQTGIVFVKMPGGTFWMGAQQADPNGQNYDPEVRSSEGPVHEVTLSPFLIAKYEVTQGQWTKVMGSNPSNYKGVDDRPVENISWDEIQGFEAKTGLTLSTEAQWEYACRAGTTTPFAGKIEDLGWFDGNSGRMTHTVGKKAQNAFGLYDTHGNVWELCQDVYDEKFYSKSEAAGPDPVCTSGSVDRVIRGGCRGDSAGNCRSASRIWIDPASRDSFIGFRPSAPAP